MGKSSFNAAKAARYASNDQDGGEADRPGFSDGTTDVTFHTAAWHQARIDALTRPRVSYEEWKAKADEEEAKKNAVADEEERHMREFRAQLEADRALRMGKPGAKPDKDKDKTKKKKKEKKSSKDKKIKKDKKHKKDKGKDKKSSKKGSKDKKRRRSHSSSSSSDSESDSGSSGSSSDSDGGGKKRKRGEDEPIKLSDFFSPPTHHHHHHGHHHAHKT